MFNYIPKSIWFPTSVDVKQVATIEELEKLCKAGEVERVVIPFTYYGYGASIIDDSNRRSIQKHYAANRFKDYGYSLTMSSYQFLKHEDFRELVEELQEKYPVFDASDHSALEYERKLEFLVDEIETVLDRNDLFIGGNASGYWTKHYVQLVLEDSGKFEPIDWIDSVMVDTDGTTIYAKEEDIEMLALQVQELSEKLWGKSK